MNTAIQCIIFLAGITFCTSAVIMPTCQCVQMNKGVNPSRISDIKIYKPRPHCSKLEIIVILKDGSSRCLDPKEKFIQAVVKTWQKQNEIRAAKMNTTPKTTTA